MLNRFRVLLFLSDLCKGHLCWEISWGFLTSKPLLVNDSPNGWRSGGYWKGMDGSRVSVNYCKIFVFPHTKKVLWGKHISAVLQEHSKSIYAMYRGCILLLHIAMCREIFLRETNSKLGTAWTRNWRIVLWELHCIDLIWEDGFSSLAWCCGLQNLKAPRVLTSPQRGGAPHSYGASFKPPGPRSYSFSPSWSTGAAVA